jgi:hypothetical protein
MLFILALQKKLDKVAGCKDPILPPSVKCEARLVETKLRDCLSLKFIYV